MAYLVADDALQLIAVELVQQPGGDGHGCVVGAAPGGEGVQRRVIDDVDIRHLLQAGGYLHLLHHVIKPGMVVRPYLVGIGHAQDDAVSLEEGYQVHNAPDQGGDNQAGNRVPQKVIADHEAYQEQENAHEGYEDDRTDLVVPYLFPHRTNSEQASCRFWEER